MHQCSSGKVCFMTKESGEEALLQNRAKYHYAAGQGPINIYQCNICESFHFTSKGDIHPMLKDKDTLKLIDKLRQGWDWENKLK